MRICVKCRHHIGGGSDSLWDHFCGYMKRMKAQCPVTGRWAYKDENDLGKIVLTDDEHPYCFRINTDGECPHWEAR